MPARLDPEERERRRKARVAHSFSDAAYQHYDPKLGHGSYDEWIRTAESALGSDRVARAPHSRGSSAKISPDLIALGLLVMPLDLKSLKTAFRKAMFTAHPDHGGTNAAAIAVTEAFHRLARGFK
jgi:hypothetical protein